MAYNSIRVGKLFGQGLESVHPYESEGGEGELGLICSG